MSYSMKLRVPPVDVFAVREDQDGRQHEFIDQTFKFSSAYLSSETVCFRLAVTVRDGDHNDTLIYLQVTPDHLDSLRFEPCTKRNRSPPHLDSVRRRLGGKGDLTRLQFRLRSGIYAQLIVSNDSPDYEALVSPARHTLDLVASVAASSSFSLYLPANQLSKQLLKACVEAVERSSVLTQEELRSYQRAVDLQRLYRGKGGKVLATKDYDGISRPETDSCATTVDFDIVPRHQGPPPLYGECINEGEKPRAISHDAGKFLESSLVDCAPPEYSDTEQSRNVSIASKRVRQCGDEDVLLHPSSKRVHPQGSFTTIPETASTRNAPGLEAKPRPEFDDADDDRNMLLRNLMRRLEQQEQQMKQLRQEQQTEQLRQEHQIKQLQVEVGKLRRQNADLEGRFSKVEDICDNLEHRQGLVKEDFENLDVHIGELEEFCEKLEKQMPHISDELEDLVRDKISDMLEEHMGDLVKRHASDLVGEYIDKGGGGNLSGPLREYVRKNVTIQMAKMKAKMCEVLQE
ncbi:hypothetical protein CT0861_09524 [Colletotrichum tofieldiae]|uniref:Uncharacterized protein n=1 Tax=Colletotrichum tofieldiae TaxID=708197 RepID=A0A166MTQ3_9PEZI|nr:hypothetical protein CT0861_09524 [Colletotrichum tofieldiae]GKT92426.1 hypothetical protein Ct61P_10276 [Colletotrichum tofieldiae]